MHLNSFAQHADCLHISGHGRHDDDPDLGRRQRRPFAGATGRLRNIFADSESNIVASINSTTSLSRLVYEFDVNPDNDVSNPNIRFSFVAAVPEPSTCAMAFAGLACGGYSMWRRRKRA
jgi:hypothetical protein